MNLPEVVVCPKLGKLVLAFSINRGMFNLKDIIGMGATKVLGGGQDSGLLRLLMDKMHLTWKTCWSSRNMLCM